MCLHFTLFFEERGGQFRPSLLLRRDSERCPGPVAVGLSSVPSFFPLATGFWTPSQSCRGGLTAPVCLRMAPVPAPWRGSVFGRGTCATVGRTVAICGAGPPDFFGPAPSPPLEWLSTISTGSKIPETIPLWRPASRLGSFSGFLIQLGPPTTRLGSFSGFLIPLWPPASLLGSFSGFLIPGGQLPLSKIMLTFGKNSDL